MNNPTSHAASTHQPHFQDHIDPSLGRHAASSNASLLDISTPMTPPRHDAQNSDTLSEDSTLVINTTDQQHIRKLRHKYQKTYQRLQYQYEQQLVAQRNQIMHEMDVWKMRVDVLGRENLLLKDKLEQKSSYLEQLKDQVLQLREENTSAHIEVDILRKSADEKVRERDLEWRDQLNAKQAELDALYRQISDMKLQREQRDSEWKDATVKLKGSFEEKVREELRHRDAQMDEAREELAQLLKQMESEKERHSSEMKSSKEQNEKLIQALEEANERFATLSTNYSKHSTELSELKDKFTAAQSECEALTNQVNELRDEKAALNETLSNERTNFATELSRLTETLSSERANFDTEESKLIVEVQNVRSELDGLRISHAESIANFENEAQRMSEDIAAKSADLTQLQKAHEELKSRFEEGEVARANLTTQLSEEQEKRVSLQEDNAKRKEEMSVSESRIQVLTAELDGVRATLQETQDEVAQTITSLAESRAEADTLKSQLSEESAALRTLTELHQQACTDRDHLTTKAQQLSDTVAQNETLIAEFRETNATLSQTLQERELQIQQQSQQLSILNQETQQLEQSVFSHTKTIQSLEASMESVQNTLRTRDESISNLEAQNQSLTKQLRDSEESAKALLRVSQKKDQKIESLTEDFDRTTQLNAELKLQVDSLLESAERHRTDYQNKAAVLQKQISANEQKIASLETAIAYKDDSIRDLESQLTSTQQEVEKERLNAENIRSKYQQLCQEHNAMEKRAADLTDNNVHLEERCRDLDLKSMRAEKQEASTAKRLTEVQDKLRAVQEENMDLEQNMREKTDALEALNENVERLTRQLTHAQEELFQLQKAKKQLTRENQELLSESGNLKRENSELRDDLDNAQHNANQQREALAAQLEQKMQSLRTRLTTLEEANANLTMTLEEQKIRLASQEATIAQNQLAEQELLRLREESSASTRRIQDLELQVRIAQEEKASLQSTAVSATTSELETAQNNLTLMQVECRQKDAQISSLQKQLSESQLPVPQPKTESDTLELQRSIDEIKKDRDVWKNMAEEKSDRVREHIKTIETQKEELFALNHKVELLEKRNTTLTAEIDDYRAQLEKLNSELQTALRQHEDMKDKLSLTEEENATLQSTMHSMDEMYSGKDTAIHNMRAERDAMAKELAAHRDGAQDKEVSLVHLQQALADSEDSKQKLQQHQDEVIAIKEDEIAKLKQRIEELEQQLENGSVQDADAVSASSSEGVSPFASEAPSIAAPEDEIPEIRRGPLETPLLNLASVINLQPLENSTEMPEQHSNGHSATDDGSSLDPSEEMYTDSDSDVSSDESEELVLSPRKPNQYASVIGDLLRSTQAHQNMHSHSPIDSASQRGSLSPRSTASTKATRVGGASAKFEAVQRMIKRLEQRPTAASVSEEKITELKKKYHDIFKHIQRVFTSAGDNARQRRELLTSLHQAFSTALKRYMKRISTLRTENEQQTMEIQEHYSSTRRSVVLLDSKIKKMEREISSSERHLKALSVRWKERSSKKGQNPQNEAFLEGEMRNISNDIHAEEDMIRRYTSKIENFKKQRETQRDLMQQSQGRIEQAQREKKDLGKLMETVRRELQRCKEDVVESLSGV